MDLTEALYPVDDVSDLEEGDYIAAVTSEDVYIDRFDSGRHRGSEFYDMFLQDGVLANDHSYIEVPKDLPSEKGFLRRGNTVQELYQVSEKYAPEQPFSEHSLVEVAQELQP